jgi:hypothetical protein
MKQTNFMELSPSWEAANYATIQELPNILWNSKVHCCVLKSPPLVPILIQIDSVHTTPSYLRFILILTTHLSLGLPSGPFLSGFPTNILHAFLFAPFVLYALPISFSLTYHSNHTWREYKLWSSLCSFLTSRHFISLWSKYSPQRPVLKYPQSVSLL